MSVRTVLLACIRIRITSLQLERALSTEPSASLKYLLYAVLELAAPPLLASRAGMLPARTCAAPGRPVAFCSPALP